VYWTGLQEPSLSQKLGFKTSALNFQLIGTSETLRVSASTSHVCRLTSLFNMQAADSPGTLKYSSRFHIGVHLYYRHWISALACHWAIYFPRRPSISLPIFWRLLCFARL